MTLPQTNEIVKLCDDLKIKIEAERNETPLTNDLIIASIGQDIKSGLESSGKICNESRKKYSKNKANEIIHCEPIVGAIGITAENIDEYFSKDEHGFYIVKGNKKYNFYGIHSVTIQNDVEAYFENCTFVWGEDSSIIRAKNCISVAVFDKTKCRADNCRYVRYSTENNVTVLSITNF